MLGRRAGTVIGSDVAVGPFWRRGHTRTLKEYKLKKAKKCTRDKAKPRRDLINEIMGFAPYEARVIEGVELRERKTAKNLKKRIGNLRRSKKKLEELKKIARALKKKEEEHQALLHPEKKEEKKEEKKAAPKNKKEERNEKIEKKKHEKKEDKKSEKKEDKKQPEKKEEKKAEKKN